MNKKNKKKRNSEHNSQDKKGFLNKKGVPGSQEQEKKGFLEKKGVPGSQGKQGFIKYEGTVVTPIKAILFSVRLDESDEVVLCYLSGNMRRYRVRVMLADRVLIELDPSSPIKGRIIDRLPHRPTSASQGIMKQTEDDQQAKEAPELSKDTESKNKISSNPIQSKYPKPKKIRQEKRDIPNKNPNKDGAD